MFRFVSSAVARPAGRRWLASRVINRTAVRSLCTSPLDEPREGMDYDVVVVGAGPAGLAMACRLKQLANAEDRELSVCVVEKGAEVGSHILSGNVFEPRALNELFPEWESMDAPLETKVEKDEFHFFTEKGQVPLPTPPSLHNDGNYIISLGHLVRWLGTQAEELGVEIYPGFSASEVLYNEDNAVVGVATSDMGIGKDGQPTANFARGMELRAKQTVLAEGCRGSLSEDIMDKYELRKDCDPQTYGLGIKEVWRIDEAKHKPGLVRHSIGWPLDTSTYGGSFMYHKGTNEVLLGLVVGLDYSNPYLSPYQEFQRWKQHPSVRAVLEGGECVSYGARAINEGGLQSIPKLTFKGGMMVGCSAGFLNVPKIKGSHTAMKSGMVAAEAVYAAAKEGGEEGLREGAELVDYESNLKESWVYEELRAVRNYHPSFHKFGFWGFLAYCGLESFVLKGRGSWTFGNDTKDCDRTKKASECEEIVYPKPDGVISFDLLTNLQRSGVYHEDDQPAHLKVKPDKAHVPLEVSYAEYAGPEARFCPAKVYEYHTDEDGNNPKLVINAQNCVHCKTCSIKTPNEYIKWTVPEGAGGPAYEAM